MKFAHTTDAIWTCDLLTAVDVRGRLRATLVVLTPFDRRFREFKRYARPPARVELATQALLDMLNDEVWYRRPRVVESPDADLIRALRERTDRGPAVRCIEPDERIEEARRFFEDRMMGRRCAA